MENKAAQIDERLLSATIRLNTILLALVCGLFGGVSLFFMTFVSLYRGLPNPGHYLNLLGVIFPGYNVSPSGAWIGLLWGSVFGGIVGAVIYRIYARSIREQASAFLGSGKVEEGIEYVTMRFGGHSLGMALGAVIAIGLLVSTNWLVIRGTSDDSIHAALLANYLPGYKVSLVGSLVGAVELFVLVYLVCLLLSWIYNSVAEYRHGGSD